MLTAKALAGMIGAKRGSNGRYMACCPAHNDSTPSLSFMDSVNGKGLLINCFAGCKYPDIIDAFRRKGIEIAQPKVNGIGSRVARLPKGRARVIDRTHPYPDETGTPLYETVRFTPKGFLQRRPDGNGGWVWNLNGVRRVLYRLPEVIEAVEKGQLIVISEGEKDCDNLARLGIAATTNVCGAKAKWLPEYSKTLRGADVVICPDKDKSGREHADDAEASLQGIADRVRVIEVPGPHKDVSEWLAAGGTREQLDALIEGAPDWQPQQQEQHADDADLAQMNSNHAVVNVGGKTRVVSFKANDELILSTIDDFKAFHANRKKSEGDRKIGIGQWWLNHPDRRQYDGLTFAPGLDHAVGGQLNLWRGFACKPKPGDCSLYLAHVRDNICSGNLEHYDYLLDVMADAVQNPNRQGEVAVVVRSSEEGTGKGVFVKNFGKLFGRHFAHVSHASHLTGKFNAHLERCCVLFGDECFWAGDRQHEGVLKAIVTEETIMVERKGIDPIQLPNRVHLFISSNNDWVVPASATARRFFVLDVSPQHKQDRPYFAAIENQMANGGREALLHMLLNRDISRRDIRQVPHTDALAAQKNLSRRGVDRLIEIIAHDGILPCAHEVYRDIALTSGEGENKGFYAHAKAIVPDLKFQNSQVVATNLVDDWGCTRWKSGTVRGIRFPPLADLRARFDAKHGSQSWSDCPAWE